MSTPLKTEPLCDVLTPAIAGGDQEPLVAFVDGTLPSREAMATVLAHLERCQACAERLRVILVLRGAPTGGEHTFTPASMAANNRLANRVM